MGYLSGSAATGIVQLVLKMAQDKSSSWFMVLFISFNTGIIDINAERA